MTARKPMFVTPLILVLSTSGLAAFAAWREPDGLLAFLAAMLLLPVAWSIIELRNRGRAQDDSWLEDMTTIRWSISAAALMMLLPLAGTLAISYELTETLGDDMEKRVMGVLFGIIFLYYGNASSKRPVNLHSRKHDPARLQKHNRVMARAFVLAGLLYAVNWMFAPINWALPAGMLILLSSVLISIVSLIRVGRG